MKQFVGRKNDLAGAQLDGTKPQKGDGFDDLRMDTRSGSRNSNRQPSQRQTVKNAAHSKAEQTPQSNPVQIKREPIDDARFYDTDASSMGGDSTATSIKQTNVGISEANQQHHQQGLSEPDDQESAEGDESGPEESPHNTAGHQSRPLGGAIAPSYRNATASQTAPHMSSMFDQMVQQYGRDGFNAPNGRSAGGNWPKTKDDSYPTTTSGTPSIPPEVDEGSGIESKHRVAGSGLVHRQSSRGLRPDAATDRAKESQATTNETHVGHGVITRPNGLSHGDIEQQATPNPVFAKPAPKQQMNVSLPKQNRQQSATAANLVPLASDNTAHRSSAAAHDHPSYQAPQVEHHQPKGSKDAREVLLHQSNGVGHAKLQQRQTRQQAMQARPAPQPEDFAADDDEPESDASVQGQEDANDPRDGMDYDRAQLDNMDYDALKAQSFDVDPNAAAVQDSLEPGSSITDRVATIAKVQPRQQVDFFNSLSMKDWEEAGDWFIGQFNGLVGKLKEVRQEKRKAAQGFEDEIEGRYKAVGQKRKQIDTALGDMRESGGKVLQGTPKKTKTR